MLKHSAASKTNLGVLRFVLQTQPSPCGGCDRRDGSVEKTGHAGAGGQGSWATSPHTL